MWDVVAVIAVLVVAYVWWTDGFAALTAARPVNNDSPRAVKKPTGAHAKADVLFLYGSQTGTAEGFAKTLHKEAGRLGISSTKLVDGEDYPSYSLGGEKVVIVTVATFGEGEPTDGFKTLFDWIMEEDRAVGEELRGVKYAVFGLGDRQYKHFCKIAVDMDKRMAELGAERIYGLGQGDAGRDMEEEFDLWRQDLWPTVGRALSITLKTDTEEPTVPDFRMELRKEDKPTAHAFIPAASMIEPNAKTPAYLSVANSTELLVGCADRSTRDIVLSLGDSALSYQAGDHLGVLPRNTDKVVDEYLKALGAEADADTVVALLDENNRNQLPAATTVRNALRWYLDLGGHPKKAVLRAFAHYCTDAAEKEKFLALLRVNDKAQDEYKKLCGKVRTVFGFLRKFSSCKVPLAHFLEAMPRIAPRYFSIASDQLRTPKTIGITVAIVDGGVCTSMLAAAAPGEQVPCFVRKSTFHLPLRAKQRPLVMIGPGTGVAPLVGFLHRRLGWKARNNTLGEAHLFFGCRKEKEDFIHGKFLQSCIDDGVLTGLKVAFSRDTDKKVYVQHKLEEEAALVWRLLGQEGANLYLCGDSRYMAPDVEATLVRIFEKEGGLTKPQAEERLEKLAAQERYFKDVWAA